MQKDCWRGFKAAFYPGFVPRWFPGVGHPLYETFRFRQADALHLKQISLLEGHLRKLSLIAVLVFPFLILGTVQAQQFDAAFGVGTLVAPSASSATGNHQQVSLTGGAYPVFSADILLKRQFGISGELA